MIICGGSERKKSTPAPPGRPDGVVPFVWTLFSLLNEPYAETLVEWSSDGAGIVFADPSRFAAEVCPRYFLHSKWKSFHNALNRLDFRKWPNSPVDGPNRVEFRHAHFRRRAEGELHRIERKKSTAATPATPRRPDGVASYRVGWSESKSYMWTLFSLLNGPYAETLVEWSSDGERIVFADPPRFAAEVCPRYFPHSGWRTFESMLQTYDFHRRTISDVDGSNRVEFRHAHFRRGAEGELHRIERKKSPAERYLKAAVKLWTMATNEEETLVAWSPGDDCVVISDAKRFASEVCPRYFVSYDDFEAGLSSWGFRHKTWANKVEIRHALFRRGAGPLDSNFTRKYFRAAPKADSELHLETVARICSDTGIEELIIAFDEFKELADEAAALKREGRRLRSEAEALD